MHECHQKDNVAKVDHTDMLENGLFNDGSVSTKDIKSHSLKNLPGHETCKKCTFYLV